jgi:predicted HicB family RNase H-like nuclease
LYVQNWSPSSDLLLIFQNFVRTLLGMESRMGRPPKGGDKAMAGRLEIRVDPAEKLAYDQAAEAAGMERSDWIRATLNAAAKRAVRGKRLTGNG